MKLHSITSLIVIFFFFVFYYVISNQDILGLVLFISISFFIILGVIKFYKFVYQSVKNILG
jgi:hypothetical protein